MSIVSNKGMTDCFAYLDYTIYCRALNRRMHECNPTCAFYKTLEQKRKQEEECAARLKSIGRKYGIAAYHEWRRMMDGETIDDGTEDW